MPEVEIHAGHGHELDAFGRRVSILVAVMGVVLALAQIVAHRAHTAAILTRTEVNDDWSFYSAKKDREHLLDVGTQLAENLTTDPKRIAPMVAKFDADRHRYLAEAEELQKKARDTEAEGAHQEQRALRMDTSEGFLELGLVLSSLYFLARRRFFPYLGMTASLAGIAVGIWGFLS
jgi:uncharacterized protein YfcZ (UPF0381/DUF406 family)